MPTMPASSLRILALGRQTWARGTPGHETWSTPHALTHHELWIVWSGVGEISCPGFSHHLTQGTAVLLRPGTTYAVRQNPKAPLSVNYFQIHQPRLPRETVCINLPDHSLYEAVSRRILDLYWETFAAAGWKEGPRSPRVLFTREPEHIRTGAFCPNPVRMWSPSRAASVPAIRCAHSLLASLLEDFLLRLRSGPRPAPQVLGLDRKHRDSMLALAARIRREPTSTPAQLAREAGYSPDHFARVFHRVVGSSPKAFLLAARIERAKELLAQSHLTVKEIADSLDYSSPYFFSRQFHAATGSTPSDFRTHARSGGKPAR